MKFKKTDIPHVDIMAEAIVRGIGETIRRNGIRTVENSTSHTL
jgi:hypothetical protein